MRLHDLIKSPSKPDLGLYLTNEQYSKKYGFTPLERLMECDENESLGDVGISYEIQTEIGNNGRESASNDGSGPGDESDADSSEDEFYDAEEAET